MRHFPVTRIDSAPRPRKQNETPRHNARATSTVFAASVAFLLLFAIAPAASARGEAITVGRQATWLHLPSGQARVDGRPIGTLSIQRSKLARTCQSIDPDFDGYARIRPIRRRHDGWRVRVECLEAPTDRTAPSED